MKIVIMSSGKEFNLAPVGYIDTVENQLQFKVLKDNFTLDEIYEAFSGDTSALKFLFDNGDIAWIKNNFSSIKDFHPYQDFRIGRDTTTNTDKVADVVDIILSSDDTKKRLTNMEDSVKKVTMSTLATAAMVEKKTKEIDTKLATVEPTLADLTKKVNDATTAESDTVNAKLATVDEKMTAVDAKLVEVDEKLKALQAAIDKANGTAGSATEEAK